MSSDPIGDALRADAEAARAEIRAAGLVCPSCGKNAADLIGTGHRYEEPANAGISLRGSPGATLRCAEGEPVTADSLSYEQVCAVANIGVLDDFWRHQDEAFAQIVGTGPPNFTGFLDAL